MTSTFHALSVTEKLEKYLVNLLRLSFIAFSDRLTRLLGNWDT